MKKITRKPIRIIIFAIILSILAIFIPWLSFWISDYLCGSKNNLGNNIYMVEDGDFREIVYCTKHKGNTCYVGIPIIPKISNDEISVIDAKSTDEWVIVKAWLHHANSKNHCFYLIDKSFDVEWVDFKEKDFDSIIQGHITYFDNEQDFENKLNDIGIKLHF